MIGTTGFGSFTRENVRITAQHIGSISITGDMIGLNSNIPEIFVFGGDERAAISKLTIGGSMTKANVTVGITATFQGAPANADAQIGSVVIRGSMASATIATVDDGAGVTDNVNLTSRIASIQILGQFSGNSVIRAEEIGSLKLGAATVPLKAGARNDTTTTTFPPGTASVAEYT